MHGDAFVDIRRFDALVWVEDALPEVRYDLTASETDQKIGKLVAGMIEDGATFAIRDWEYTQCRIKQFGKSQGSRIAYRNVFRWGDSINSKWNY